MSKNNTNKPGLKHSAGDYITALLVTLLCMVITFALKGLVLTSMWQWFILPLTGLATPNIYYLIGFTLFLDVLAGGFKNKRPDFSDGEHPIDRSFFNLGTNIGYYGIVWLCGYVVHAMNVPA